MQNQPIRGGTFSALTIRLADQANGEAMKAVQQQIKLSPGFYRHAAVVFDLRDSVGYETLAEFQALKTAARTSGLLPIGVTNGDESQQRAALGADLPSLSPANAPASVQPNVPKVQPNEPAEVETHELNGGTMLVDKPVRSGMRLYAQGGDLIVAASVSSGAEVMADGHIHIYGRLRGSAHAGVTGDNDARVFCRDLQAELIVVGDRYLVSDDIDRAYRGKAVMVQRRGDRLVIEPI
ncbi:MAG: septum site-determining protein MinC [Geminicoccaceae bacterium]